MDIIYIINLFLQNVFETTCERTVNNPTATSYKNSPKNDIETGLYYRGRPFEWCINKHSDHDYNPQCEV